MANEQAGPSLAELADTRIEACLSACEGIETEMLERMGEHALALTRERLERYQDFTHRLLGALAQIRTQREPSGADLAVLDTLRVEAAFLIHQESVVRGSHAEH